MHHLLHGGLVELNRQRPARQFPLGLDHITKVNSWIIRLYLFYVSHCFAVVYDLKGSQADSQRVLVIHVFILNGATSAKYRINCNVLIAGDLLSTGMNRSLNIKILDNSAVYEGSVVEFHRRKGSRKR